MPKKTRTILIICASVLVLALAVFAAVYFTNRPETSAGGKTITFEVTYADGQSESFEINTDAEFLRGALEQEKLIAGDESEMGLFVKSINGVAADDTKNEYWSFSKGGEMLMTGVDDTPIADGDSFEAAIDTF
jgi:opacity protein-like surface antigen